MIEYTCDICDETKDVIECNATLNGAERIECYGCLVGKGIRDLRTFVPEDFRDNVTEEEVLRYVELFFLEVTEIEGANRSDVESRIEELKDALEIKPEGTRALPIPNYRRTIGSGGRIGFSFGYGAGCPYCEGSILFRPFTIHMCIENDDASDILIIP